VKYQLFTCDYNLLVCMVNRQYNIKTIVMCAAFSSHKHAYIMKVFMTSYSVGQQLKYLSHVEDPVHHS
jgi:hypothetical protein